MANKHIDELSGIETTGHEWDGLKELNNPLPRWWLWTFYACVIWAVGYWVVYPAWPLVTDYTRGMFGDSDRLRVQREVSELEALRATNGAGLASASLEDIRSNPDYLQFALANGKAAFGDNCAPCHGSGAAGAKGYPNLNDDDWLWGGTLEDIHTTLENGIRWDANDDTRISDMPAFGRDGILESGQIRNVAAYVLSLSGTTTEGADIAEGQTLFADNCAACHGEDATGTKDLGAPNLRDAIWLYGGDLPTVVETITNSRHGVMPAWGGRLDEVTIKSLAVYVHSLGGGQ
ncbi:MAG: cytochrome-c oxidase, cbb3-type subunit III [Rhodobiaceae bacterium]|nr:cytochrome-c oxidase, cbb3-type subunit III [Rhodobiaceae bacterium]